MPLLSAEGGSHTPAFRGGSSETQHYIAAGTGDPIWGIHVTQAGYTKVRPGASATPGGSPRNADCTPGEYRLHYLACGRGIFESEPSGQRQISAGDFCLTFPGVRYRCIPQARIGWDQYWVSFTGPYIDKLLNRGTLRPDYPFARQGCGQQPLEQFRDIFTLLQAKSAAATPVISAQAMLLLARLLFSRGQGGDEKSDTERIVHAAKGILRAHLNRDIDLEMLAQTLNTSYTSLRRRFRLSTGCSLHQFHLQLRLQKAWQLLSSGGCTVREAAELTGFSDEFYFSRLFKTKTGRSPETLKTAKPVNGPTSVEVGERHRAAS